jgi:hypothetical protein
MFGEDPAKPAETTRLPAADLREIRKNLKPGEFEAAFGEELAGFLPGEQGEVKAESKVEASEDDEGPMGLEYTPESLDESQAAGPKASKLDIEIASLYEWDGKPKTTRLSDVAGEEYEAKSFSWAGLIRSRYTTAFMAAVVLVGVTALTKAMVGDPDKSLKLASSPKSSANPSPKRSAKPLSTPMETSSPATIIPPEKTPTPAPTPTPTPESTLTPTPEPTPTPTLTPIPAPTPTPTPTPSPSPNLSPTPTPALIQGLPTETHDKLLEKVRYGVSSEEIQSAILKCTELLDTHAKAEEYLREWKSISSNASLIERLNSEFELADMNEQELESKLIDFEVHGCTLSQIDSAIETCDELSDHPDSKSFKQTWVYMRQSLLSGRDELVDLIFND